jgi:hypothetical protein
VRNISSARFLPIARDNGTTGVEQKRPIFTPGVAKLEADVRFLGARLTCDQAAGVSA